MTIYSNGINIGTCSTATALKLTVALRTAGYVVNVVPRVVRHA